MRKTRSRRQADHALVVLVIIACAIGCALWDVQGVSNAIAAGKLVPAAQAAAPVPPASRPPMAAASASVAAPGNLLLARVLR